MTKKRSAPPDLHGMVGRLNRALTIALMAELGERGFDDVTPAFAAIMPLIEQDGSRQSDMARRAGLTKQAIGQLVKELTVRGYVAIERDPADSRATIVRFTDRGQALRRCGLQVKADLARRLDLDVEPADIRTMIAIGERVTTAIGLSRDD